MRQDGSWVVTTESGTMYLLDLDRDVVIRSPRESGSDIAHMRRDGDELPLLELFQEPAVGGPLMMLLDLLGNGVATIRVTSDIVDIKEATS